MTAPEVIETLCSIDMPTLMESLDTKNPELIRMVNGERPTTVQMGHIMNAAVPDWDAAREEMRNRMYVAQNSAFAASRLKTILVDKYGMLTGEVTGDVLPRMTEEDRREVSGLVAMMQDGDKL